MSGKNNQDDASCEVEDGNLNSLYFQQKLRNFTNKQYGYRHDGYKTCPLNPRIDNTGTEKINIKIALNFYKWHYF
ncbi:MAG: hypothetical protein LBR11_11855, partial [Deltaproteobacteria bacterium]|nr:hypothetical protein [Deltaproteobacteria bacterium]